ncbi:MAG: DUF2779 domain-containing protein [Deltaproteobacteria bacterium]
MPRKPMLSKSRFIYGRQCHKHLWWRCHDPKSPELVPDPSRRALFARGHRVGAEACRHIPGGFQVPFDGRQRKRSVAATAKAIAEGVEILYEAGFEHEGVFAAIDILVKEGEGWVLVEVKSTTGVKPQYIEDAAVQTWIARASGIPVTRVELMHLNRDCVYPDLSNLFTRTDISEAVDAIVPGIDAEVKAQKGMLDLPIPILAAGAHCHKPYECPFLLRCNEPLPHGDLLELHGLGAERAAPYRKRGMTSMRDLPAKEIASNRIWARQCKALETGELVVEKTLQAAIGSLSGVIGYLDFETLAPAIPVWEGCSPFTNVPAQFSLHIRRGTQITHHEWLAEGAQDPRPQLAATLAAWGGECDILYAYNAPFEQRCLSELAAAAPAHAETLLAMRARMQDLLPIVKNHVYHPDFRGSFGLKAVLPALVPGLDYSDLRVADGQLASAEIESLLLRAEELPDWRRKRMRRELHQYCARDTLALVRLHEVLLEARPVGDLEPPEA